MADKEVMFCNYCNRCLHEKLDESEEPCNTCLDSPVNEDSHKPINFIENERKTKNEKH